MTKAADDRSYHPIREFLASLPEWDKVPRVDTLLIDFLARQTPMSVRSPVRPSAAVCRVLKPRL